MKILILEGLYGNNKGKKCQWRLKRTNLKVGDTVVLNCHDWKIIKVIGEKKRFISVDYGVEGGENTSWISGYINKNGEIYINRTGYKKKEVKKVRPYFETKVVKVRKECNHSYAPDMHAYIYDGTIKCPVCGKKLTSEWLRERMAPNKQPKDNWINGENLDAIKFPCFCSYSDGEGSKRKIGFFSTNRGYYYIADVNDQKKEQKDVGNYGNYSLKQFITKNNIHILKGKIIIYEEEK